MPRRKRSKQIAPAARRAVHMPPRSAASAGDPVSALAEARNQLARRRDEIDEQIGMIERAIQTLGGRPMPRPGRPGRPPGRPRGPAGRGAPRGRRAGSLKDYISRVLHDASGPLAVKDITKRVLDSGYKTANKTLAKSVGIALTQMPEVRKVGRGMFEAK